MIFITSEENTDGWGMCLVAGHYWRENERQSISWKEKATYAEWPHVIGKVSGSEKNSRRSRAMEVYKQCRKSATNSRILNEWIILQGKYDVDFKLNFITVVIMAVYVGDYKGWNDWILRRQRVLRTASVGVRHLGAYIRLVWCWNQEDRLWELLFPHVRIWQCSWDREGTHSGFCTWGENFDSMYECTSTYWKHVCWLLSLLIFCLLQYFILRVLN